MTNRGDSGEGGGDVKKGPTADYIPSMANNNQTKPPAGGPSFVSSYMPSALSKPTSRNSSNNGRLLGGPAIGGTQNTTATRPSPVGFLAR